MIESILVGIGAGMIYGITLGLTRYYKKSHFLFLIYFILLGILLIVDPHGYLQYTADDGLFFVGSIPSTFISAQITEKEWRAYKKKGAFGL